MEFKEKYYKGGAFHKKYTKHRTVNQVLHYYYSEKIHKYIHSGGRWIETKTTIILLNIYKQKKINKIITTK